MQPPKKYAAELAPYIEREYTCGPYYDFPAFYNLDYHNYDGDIPFYDAAISEASGTAVKGLSYAELGAGHGRILLRYVLSGIQSHAIEPNTKMLDMLHARYASAGGRGGLLTSENCLAHESVCIDRFSVVAMPFNTVLHIASRRLLEATFHRARAMLSTTEGVFVLDMTAPCWEDMRAGSRPWGRLHTIDDPYSSEEHLTYDAALYDGASRTLHTWFRFITAGHDASTDMGKELKISQMMWTVEEVVSALEHVGFERVQVFDDPMRQCPANAATSHYYIEARYK